MQKPYRSLHKENNPAMSTQRRWPAARVEVPAAPDLTDFMNDSFFGTVKKDKVSYNLTGAGAEEEGGGRSKTSKLTQEWLDEAKKMVASSPDRHSPPVRRLSSPRFAGAAVTSEGPQSMDKRDPRSRSARRNRVAERVSDEILSRTARHARTASIDSLTPSAASSAFSAAAFSSSDSDSGDLPPRPVSRRKSRFNHDNGATSSPSTDAPPRRSLRRPSPTASPRPLLSPPRNLIESANRRSISSSTCSQEKIVGRKEANENPNQNQNNKATSVSPATSPDDDVQKINLFLRRQREAVNRISQGGAGKARIILSGSSTSTTSSMVAAVCYAWLLENTESGGGVVVPVMNMKRAKMGKQKQAAWVFHHSGIDASALLFADEVDLEGLLMSRQLNILVIGQDVLRTKGEVGSECTVLADNYCEHAYDLLQTPNLKKLVLAGILLDTRNLDTSTKFCTNRDAEAVQLLLVGSSPSYRHDLYEQLMQDHRDSLFLEAMMHSYGKTSSDESGGNLSQGDRRSTRKSTSISSEELKRPSSGNQKPVPAPAQAPSRVRPPPGRVPEAVKQRPAPVLAPTQEKAIETLSRAKNRNKFSLVKLFNFGFGSGSK